MVERKKIPMVEGNGAAEKIFNQGFRYTFGVLSPAKRYLEGIVDMASQQKPAAKTVAITAASDAFSQEVAAGAAAAAAAHHMQVVYNNKYPDTATDVSSVISALKQTNPDLVLNAGHVQDALLVQKGLKEQNVQAKGYGYTVGPDTPDFANSLGKDANEVFGAAQWSDAVKYHGAPGFYRTAQEYAKAFEAAYHHRPDYHNAESTAACLAFQYALAESRHARSGESARRAREPRRHDVLRDHQVRQPRPQRLQADGDEPDPERQAGDGMAEGPRRIARDLAGEAVGPAVTAARR